MPQIPATPLLPVDHAATLSLRDAAHAYAEAGHPVFPCWPGTKRPAVEHSFYEATTSHRRIDSWWHWQPEANIALRTGERIDVLDIDVHADGDGFAALRQFLDLGLTNEWAHAVRSPGGGLHLYYPSDPDRPQRTWSRDKAHTDFRGTGGYIMAPPSRVLEDGKRGKYTPIGPSYPGRPLDADRIRELLTPPKPRLPDLVAAGADLGERGTRVAGWLRDFEGSNRNEALFWAACRLVEVGAVEGDTYAYLAESAAWIGLTLAETQATIRNAYAHAGPDPALVADSTSSAVRYRDVRSL